ncbi:DUF4307 domain-containing protein [Nocardioides sp. Kera G14]|uniref:DUF4307 domain-containing protein n=1 Tax=Nocardioides sp. Kera G14 TaxID=2884264 RepID=UPI001D128AFF|nr:DUF4307 domain-containing protein [Nocardioides sp. Kera G14]UDY22962.1 DUF4307 domain-containing protein [Nocardioides sp. Kera G14]
MSEQSGLRERYAAHPSPWPKVFLAIGVVIFAGLLVWLGWVIWLKVNPAVTSNLVTWKVVDEHSVTAKVSVQLDSGAKNPTCLLRATAEDHTTVGEKSFVPHDGNNEVAIRTERTATSVESIGCTAHNQNDAR